MKHILVLICVAWGSFALAEEGQEFICSTVAGASSFYADIGRTVCDGKVTDLDKSKSVLCNYTANCVPADKAAKDLIIQMAGGKPWESISDDERNRHLALAYSKGSVQVSEQDAMSVQCIGQKLPNGDPNCPHVNDCVNNRKMSTLAWSPQLYRAFNSFDTIQGVSVKKTGRSVEGAVK